VENRDLGWSRPASGENWVPMKMNELFSRIVLADQYVARNAAERNGPESHAERSASMRTECRTRLTCAIPN
jgi:hypothetical protein